MLLFLSKMNFFFKLKFFMLVTFQGLMGINSGKKYWLLLSTSISAH